MRGSVFALRTLVEALESRLLLSVVGPDGEPWVAGDLLRPDAASQAWSDQHSIVIQDVKLNDVGLARVNAARAAKGLAALQIPAAIRGRETTGASMTGAVTAAASTGDVGGAAGAMASAVASVDNSASIYFPPIRSQGSIGSCAAWAVTYYAATYMNAFTRNINVATGGDNAILSPKWSYNLANGGSDNGSSPFYIIQSLISNGAPSWTQVPYDSNYLAWVYNNPSIWRSAIGNRMSQTGTIYNVDTDAGLAQIKTYLTNGYVLNYGCDIYGWHNTTVKNDPSTTDDDPYVGQYAISWASTNNSGHEMTVVGYNDNIWIDVNGNGVVDPGEKGALKIANSWGTGYGTNGFAWVSYDALKTTSAVTGAPTSNRTGAFWYNDVTWITARPSYTPTALAEFTVQTADRNEVNFHLGTSNLNALAPTTTWSSYAMDNDGGALGFDGVSYASNPTSAPAGTFVLDFTDIVPDLTTARRYYMQMDDTTNAANVSALTSFKLTDAAGNVLGAGTNGLRIGDLPVSDADTWGTYATAQIDYAATDIRGTVYSDKNSNGVKDAGETGLANWTVFVDSNSNGVYDTAPVTVSSGGINLAIPDATSNGSTTTPGAINSTLNVSGFTNVLTDVNVNLTITHSSVLQLSVYLTDPSGNKVQLLYSGHSGANYTNTTLDDQAASYIGSAPYTGVFKPDNPMTVFNGLSPNGTWTLNVTDGVTGTTGTLNSWSLALTAPEPAVKTDSTGAYYLSRLAAGSYTVRAYAPTGFNVTAPAGGAYTDTIAAQQVLTGRDFGINATAPTVATPASATYRAPTTANLAVLGASVAGEANLTYTWSAVTKPSGAATPTFSVNGTNAAKNTIITFNRAGTWVLRATITDTANQSVTSDVTYVIAQNLTTITLTPASVTMAPGGSRTFTASALDQFAVALTTQPSFTWSLDSGSIGSITSTTATTATYTAPTGVTGSATLRAASGGVSATAIANVVTLGIFSAAADLGAPAIAGSSGQASGLYTLTAGGNDIWNNSDQFQYLYMPLNGDGTITARVLSVTNTNTWAKAGVMFRNTLTADSAHTSLFVTPGSGISFQMRASAGGSSSNPAGVSGAVAPYWVRIARSGNNFTAYTSTDGVNWGSALTTQSVTMNTSIYVGLALTSHNTGSLCTATFDNVSVVLPNQAPTIATAAAATPSPVAGKTTNLSVLGADDAGEVNLTYVWSTVTKPTGAASPTFSATGSNTAKNVSVTFYQAGSYTFRATLTDAGGLTATSDVTVTVNQTLTTIALTCPTGTVPSGVTQNLSAAASDQFGKPMTATCTWSTTGGTINSSGQLSTPADFGGNVSVTASAGSVTSAPGSVSFVPTAYGSAGNDALTFALGTGDMVQITTNGTIYSIARSLLPALTYHAGAGVNMLTLDCTNGSPLPAGGLTFDGSGTNTLTVLGAGLTDTYGITGTTLSRGGTALLTYANLTNLNLTAASVTTTANLTLAGALTVGYATTPTAWTVSAGVTTTVGRFDIEAGATMTIQGTLRVTPGAIASVNLLRGSLTLGGTTNNWTGTLDLNSNDLLIQVPVGQDVDAVYATLVNQLKSGAQGGVWTGTTGITSSSAANSGYTMGLGAVPNAQLNGFGIGYTAFDNVAVDDNSILVKYTLMGDVNLDGTIDSLDYYFIESAFNNNQVEGNPILTGYINGDFNYDGTIDSADYYFIDSNFNNLNPLSAMVAILPLPAIRTTWVDQASKPVLTCMTRQGILDALVVLPIAI